MACICVGKAHHIPPFYDNVTNQGQLPVYDALYSCCGGFFIICKHFQDSHIHLGPTNVLMNVHVITDIEQLQKIPTLVSLTTL